MLAKAVIIRLCELQAEVCRETGYAQSADCFCGTSGFGERHVHDDAYRNDGAALEFIEQAVREKLAAMRAEKETRVTDESLERLRAAYVPRKVCQDCGVADGEAHYASCPHGQR